MHYWPNPSITRTLKPFDVKKFKANRPKAIADDVWNQMVADERMNKLIMLNQVPKESRKADSPRRAEKE
jgi:hypothetical protein